MAEDSCTVDRLIDQAFAEVHKRRKEFVAVDRRSPTQRKERQLKTVSRPLSRSTRRLFWRCTISGRPPRWSTRAQCWACTASDRSHLGSELFLIVILDLFFIQIWIYWFSFLHRFSLYIRRGVVPSIYNPNWLINKISLPFYPENVGNYRISLNLYFSFFYLFGLFLLCSWLFYSKTLMLYVDLQCSFLTKSIKYVIINAPFVLMSSA